MYGTSFSVSLIFSIKDGGKDGLLEVVSAEHSKLSAMVLELTESDDQKPTKGQILPNIRGESKRKGAVTQNLFLYLLYL